MLRVAARIAIAAPQRVIAGTLLVMVAAALFGVPVAKSLSAGGMFDPASESSQASRLLSDKFGQGDLTMVIGVTSDSGFNSPAAREAATGIVRQLQESPDVGQVTSAWTSPVPSALVSKDGKTGLIVAGVKGDDNAAQARAKGLATAIDHDRDGVTIRAGGEATIYWQINAQTTKDLLLMETLVLPLSFVVLVWVFGGLFAAALPMTIGIFAILGSMAALRATTMFTEVSIFALNLCIALGLALAIDYTLLILSRYRNEIADGATRDAALIRTMTTAGRTVLFSAMTVALSMATMIVFPQYFLKSFAYAGVIVVAIAAIAAVVVTPAGIVLLGDRIDRFDVRTVIRRVLGRPDAAGPVPVEQTSWYRWTKFVMGHAVPIGLAVVALLFALGSPFLGVKFGFPDDRVLPTSASARQVGEQLRSDFAVDQLTNISVVIPDSSGLRPAEVQGYASRLSRVAQVLSVSAVGGTWVDGRLVGPASAPAGDEGGAAFMTITSAAPLYSDASEEQLDELHAIPVPAGKTVLLGGTAQANRDTVEAITSRLPLVLGLIGGITLVLLFLLTGSVLLPIKAVVLNVLSLSAAFGALVWVFQEGHFGALGAEVTGTLEVDLPVLLFCVAFGLSMDYEVFLLSRIREHWLESDRSPAANDESVALGVARTGRVITAAALLMAISFGALMAARVTFMRMLGLGLSLAVLMDATLVRMVLVPAFMRVLGTWNWWAPEPLARLHRRFGLQETPRRGVPEATV